MENSFSFIFKDFSCICYSASQTRKLAGWQWLFQTSSECFFSPLRMKDRYLSLELGGTARARFPPFLQSHRRWPVCTTPQLTMHRAIAVTHTWGTWSLPNKERGGQRLASRGLAVPCQGSAARFTIFWISSVCPTFTLNPFFLKPAILQDFTSKPDLQPACDQG